MSERKETTTCRADEIVGIAPVFLDYSHDVIVVPRSRWRRVWWRLTRPIRALVRRLRRR